MYEKDASYQLSLSPWPRSPHGLEVHMYDDDSRNLEAFKSLQNTYPDIKFKAFLAEHNKLIYRR